MAGNSATLRNKGVGELFRNSSPIHLFPLRLSDFSCLFEVLSLFVRLVWVKMVADADK